MDPRPPDPHQEWLPPAQLDPEPSSGPPGGPSGPPPAPPKTGSGWLIPAAIVVAGIMIAVAVLISRKTSEPAPAVQTAVAPAIPAAPVTTAPGGTDPPQPSPSTGGDTQAQQSLESVITFAQGAWDQSGSYAGVTSFELATAMSSYTFQPPTSESTGATDLSVSATPNLFSAAAMSSSGTCFWIRVSNGTQTGYGTGTPCTGSAAVGAVFPSWSNPSSASP